MMLDAIEFLKGAISRGPTSGLFACYMVRDGQITARNEALFAGVPVDLFQYDLNIPGSELEAALGRMKTAPTVTMTDGGLVVKAGRLKTTLQCLEGESLPPPSMEQEWHPVPAALLAAIKAARPFTSDNAQQWTSGIRLMDERVTAVNNKAGIDIYVPDLALPASLITASVADFLTAGKPPAEFVHIGNAILFRWANGCWVQAQLLAIEMPTVVEQVLDSAGLDAPVKITADWRAAYADASALADSVVEVHDDGIRGKRGSSMVEVEIAVPGMPPTSWWETKVLDSIVDIATHWNPAAWPKPAFFQGDNLRGLISGIKQ